MVIKPKDKYKAELKKQIKVLLYCRVSTKKQASDGNGLDSQEARCRAYAEANGYEVIAVFPDDVSGGGDFMKRPGMVALLAFLKAQPDENYVVIFDDLKRYSRDKKFHQILRETFNALGAKREFRNLPFFEEMKSVFLFNTFEQMELGVSNGWHYADDQPANPFHHWEFSKMRVEVNEVSNG